MIHHVPVLLDEVLGYLDMKTGGTYIDATVGFGGHSRALAQRLQPGEGRLIGIDQDEEALSAAREELKEFPQVELVAGNFEDIREIALGLKAREVDGILMDLGVSTHQLLSDERGFGFMSPAPLDMRMSRSGDLTAAELVNRLPEKQLADLIYRFGEEHRSRAVARAIVRARPIQTARDLASVISGALGRRGRSHPATRTFQALRIAVNRELEVLQTAVRAALSLLKAGGRLCVISYHSLEDRIVKDEFRVARSEGMNILTPKPVVPSREECRRNPRARSAKLRVAERPASAMPTPIMV